MRMTEKRQRIVTRATCILHSHRIVSYTSPFQPISLEKSPPAATRPSISCIAGILLVPSAITSSWLILTSKLYPDSAVQDKLQQTHSSDSVHDEGKSAPISHAHKKHTIRLLKSSMLAVSVVFLSISGAGSHVCRLILLYVDWSDVRVRARCCNARAMLMLEVAASFKYAREVIRSSLSFSRLSE